MTAATLFDIAAPAAGFPGDDRCPVCDMKPCGCPTFRRRTAVALIVCTVRPGHVYAVRDADQPRRPLAWALNGPTGWQVTARGRVVGDRLTQRRAVALAQKAARALASTPTMTALTGGTTR